MKREITLGVACALPLLTFCASTPATGAPDPRDVSVKIATLNGSGCPTNTASAKVLDDGTRVAINYSDFIVRSSGPTQENCQLNMTIFTPNGYTAFIQEVSLGGYANIAAGATGKAVLSYYIAGDSVSATRTFSFTGPRLGVWYGTHEQLLGYMTAKPCGSDVPLNINTRLTMDRGTSTAASSLYMVSTEVEYNTRIQLQFRPCEE